MLVLGIITARAGSKGIVSKNMVNLGGIPLIEYTFKTAQSVDLLDRVVLSTNMQEAIDLSKAYKRIEVPFLRPEFLCEDESTHVDVVNHTVNYLEMNEVNLKISHIILLQPTTPFRNASKIDQGIDRLINSNIESVLGVSNTMHHPTEYCSKNANTGKLEFINSAYLGMRRQEFPQFYFNNGAFYGCSLEYFQREQRFYDENSELLLMGDESSIDIDTYFDLKIARGWIGQERKKTNI